MKTSKNKVFRQVMLAGILWLFTSLTLANTPAPVQAQTFGDFKNVEFVSNHDGDTLTFNIPDVHPLIGRKIAVRIRGIDTPELKGKCANEIQQAIIAKRVVGEALAEMRPGTLWLRNVDRGKYFRIVADVMISEHSLGEFLIKHGLAVVYDGGKKTHDWCK